MKRDGDKPRPYEFPNRSLEPHHGAELIRARERGAIECVSTALTPMSLSAFWMSARTPRLKENGSIRGRASP
jgi:hypothetical protein